MRDAVLLKNGPLTEEEYTEIKRHPAEGEKILSAYTEFRNILPFVRSHHERYDGKGYPDGLAGSDIEIGARIMAVADSFDAMVSNRAYRRGLSLDVALDEIRRNSGTQFDGDVVAALERITEKMGMQTFADTFCSHQNN